MVPFLTEVARRLVADHPSDLDRVIVVFNNRRSGLFLRQKFLAESRSPMFLPQTVGMDTLINEWAGLEIVPNELLLFELYEAYKQCQSDSLKYDTFEEFMSFGDMMLADFSEIDLYCVDASQLFSNLHDIKSIGEWNIETGHLTPFQEKYLQFYHSLYQLYTGFRTRLLAQHKAFVGMAYRHVAENMENITKQMGDRYYYFVGFNALSTSEERIIHRCVVEGKGTLITDGDAFYFDNDQQEAGFFLRKHKHLFPGIDNYDNHFAAGHKNITLVSCPENVLQCKYAGRIIQHYLQESPDSKLSDTAIVLGDESLLLPVLNSLPSEVRTANVTMGFPMTNTAIHSLVLKLFSLHSRRRGETFYHQDILDVISDVFVSKLLGTNDLYASLNRILFQEHVIFSDFETLSSLCSQSGLNLKPVHFLFSNSTPTPDDFLQLLSQLIQQIYVNKITDTNIREKEALACLLEITNHFQDIQNQYHFIETLSVLQKIYTRLAQRRSVAFYGEPLEGLQILGVLETRNLDFKHLILLSVNEGTLPAARSFSSLIPYNLKVAFGLPTFHEKDAVYAYNFYRLLQRADDIHILYSTEADTMGKGEPSRFIQQIRRELALQYPESITLTEEIVSADNVPLSVLQPTSADKTPSVLSRIEEIVTRGLSPSALNKYRACPLKFYYENILGIEEPDRVNEDLEQNELGSCIHAALENIFSRDTDSHIKAETLQQALDTIDSIIDQTLSIQFDHGRSTLGRNHFLKSVAKTQITNFLKSEQKYLSTVGGIEILGLEQPLSHTLDIPSSTGSTRVLISGIADRIDLTNGTIRIIDYKSGKVDGRELHVADPDPDWTSVSDKWFQLMTYEWLFYHNHNGSHPHISGIFPLRHLNSQLLTASWEGSDIITPAHLATFEHMLQQLVSDLLNPDLPFQANPGNKLCAYCPFSEICNR